MSGIMGLVLSAHEKLAQVAWSADMITTTGDNGTQASGLCNIYYRRHILLFNYTAAELQAATGKTSGTIERLRFDVTEQPVNQPLPDYAVGIKEGTFTADGDPGHTGYTVVSDPQSRSFTTGVAEEIVFDTPFSWAGGDLSFAFAWGQCPTGYDASGQTPIGAGRVFWTRTDDAGSFVINTDDTANDSTDARPVIQLYV